MVPTCEGMAMLSCPRRWLCEVATFAVAVCGSLTSGSAIAQPTNTQPATRPAGTQPTTTQALTTRPTSQPTELLLDALISQDPAAGPLLEDARAATLPKLPDLDKPDALKTSIEQRVALIDTRLARLGSIAGLPADLETRRQQTLGALRDLRQTYDFFQKRIARYQELLKERELRKQNEPALRKALADLEQTIKSPPDYAEMTDVELARRETEASEALKEAQSRLDQLRQVQADREARLEEIRSATTQKQGELARQKDARAKYLATYRVAQADTVAQKIALDCGLEQHFCRARQAQLNLAINQFNNEHIRPLEILFEEQDREYLELRVDLLKQRAAAVSRALARNAVKRYQRIARDSSPYIAAAGAAGVAVERARRIVTDATTGPDSPFKVPPRVAEAGAWTASQKNQWAEFVDDVIDRTGPQILEAYQALRKDIESAEQTRRAWAERLSDLRGQYLQADQKLQEQLDALRDARQRAADAAAELDPWTRRELQRTLESRHGIVLEKLETAIDEIDANLEKAYEDAATTYDEALAALDTHLTALREYRSQLYWRRLQTRESMPLVVDARRAPRDVRQLLDDIHRLVSGPDPVLGGIGRSIRSLPPAPLVGGLACLVGLVAAALVLRPRVHGRMEATRERIASAKTEEELAEIGYVGRLRFQVLEIIDNSLLKASVLLGLILWLAIWGLSEPRPVIRLLSLLLAAYFASDIVGSLFEPTKPRFRVIPCSSLVARHWNRRLRWQIWLAVLLLPVPLILRPFGTPVQPYLPGLTGLFMEVYAIGALLLALEFLLHRRLVLPVFGRPGQGVVYPFASMVYPFVWLGTLGLLVLQVIGYGAMVRYAVIGTFETIGVLVAAGLLRRVVRDLADRRLRALAAYQDQVRQLSEQRAQQVAAAAAEAGPAAAAQVVAAEPDVAPDTQAPAIGEIGIRFFASTVRLLLGIAAVGLIAKVWGVTLVEVREIASFELWAARGGGVTLGRVLAAVAAVVIGITVSRALRRILNSRVYPGAGLEQSVQYTINTILHYIAIALGVYIALISLHLNLSVFTVMLGTLGLGLGLGLQPLLVNFISGLMIMFERHVKVGDIVEVGSVVGTVTRIKMRSTVVKSFDNIDVVVPNSSLITEQVTNWSLDDRRIRGRIDVGVAYGSDPEEVIDILLAAAAAHPDVQPEPAPDVWFTNFGDNALTFTLVVWTDDLSKRFGMLTALRVDINRRLKLAGIEIPFPQRTLSTVGDKPIKIEMARRQGNLPAGRRPDGDTKTGGTED